MNCRLLLLLAASALAPAVGSGAEKTIGVRTLGLGGAGMPELFMRGTKDHLPVRFSAVQPSEPLRVAYQNPLPLFRLEEGPDGGQVFAPAGTVKLPASSKGILLLGWQSGKELRFTAIRDDFGSAGAGDWLLINASDKQVAFQVGKGAKAVQVKPGASATYRVTAKKNEGAAVTAGIPDGTEWKMFYSTYWPVYPDKRCLVLFFADGGKVRVKRITDRILAAGEGA